MRMHLVFHENLVNHKILMIHENRDNSEIETFYSLNGIGLKYNCIVSESYPRARRRYGASMGGPKFLNVTFKSFSISDLINMEGDNW